MDLSYIITQELCYSYYLLHTTYVIIFNYTVTNLIKQRVENPLLLESVSYSLSGLTLKLWDILGHLKSFSRIVICTYAHSLS